MKDTISTYIGTIRYIISDCQAQIRNIQETNRMTKKMSKYNNNAYIDLFKSPVFCTNMPMKK